MKVVCDNCQAKYRVPDERVAGRTLRIKCRRCGDKILVRGDQVGVSMPPAPAPGSEWYSSHGEQEQGPMPQAQLLSWLGTEGDRWDAVVWHDGMDDWQEARTVNELTSALGMPVPGSTDDSPTQMVHAGFSPSSPPKQTPSIAFPMTPPGRLRSYSPQARPVCREGPCSASPSSTRSLASTEATPMTRGAGRARCWRRRSSPTSGS